MSSSSHIVGNSPTPLIRILSLDGGGVRGLSSLLILRELMLRLKRRKDQLVRPCDFFDLIVGTGTGAISALFLGQLGMTVDEAITEYIHLAEKAFEPSHQNKACVISEGVPLDGSTLEREVGDIVARFSGSSDAGISRTSTVTASCPTAVLATTTSNIGSSPYLFRSYASSKGSPSRFTIREVAHASVATTCLFSPVKLGYPPLEFIDSCDAGSNNPIELCLEEAAAIWPGTPIECVISLGTGLQNIISGGEEWLQVVEACRRTRQSCELVHDRMILRAQRDRFPYFRFNLDRGLASVDVAEWRASGSLGKLFENTESYLRCEQVSECLDQCVGSLNGGNLTTSEDSATISSVTPWALVSDGSKSSPEAPGSKLTGSPSNFQGGKYHINPTLKAFQYEGQTFRLAIRDPREIGKTTIALELEHEPPREQTSRIPNFNLGQLRKVVEMLFDTTCVECLPFSEGGFHELYLLRLEKTAQNSLSEVLARIAFPVFPRDKLESEAATIQYLASNKIVPVPNIYAWCSDANNPVGAEYMLMEKLPGVQAHDAWEQFSFELKTKFMDQVVEYMHKIFTLRFDKIGSLYFTGESSLASGYNTDGNDFSVGPLVSMTFFEDYDESGSARAPVPSADRGPYASAFEWLASLPRAELAYMEAHPAEAVEEDEQAGRKEGFTVKQAFDNAKKVLQKGVDLASIYGGRSSSDDPAVSAYVFSLHHTDFRLVNILVDSSSAEITGFLDWEATGTAPLWACATMPWWIIDQNEGGTLDGGAEGRREKGLLRGRFLEQMDELDASSGQPSGLWRRASCEGEGFRSCLARFQLQWPLWNSDMEAWLDDTMRWVKEHPGLARPKDEL